MKVKICGLTNAKNANEVAFLGIDAIGLVFYKKSPRYVNCKKATEIIKALPPFINRVGLFANAKPSFIDKVMHKVALDTLQFHGLETADECCQYTMPFIKAIHIHNESNVERAADIYHQASGLLLDNFDKNLYGGTGKSFNWSLLTKVNIDLPIILAGGISHNTVKDAIKKVNPYAIDVSTGVESTKGIKDIAKIKQLLTNIENELQSSRR